MGDVFKALTMRTGKVNQFSFQDLISIKLPKYLDKKKKQYDIVRLLSFVKEN